MRNPLLLDGGDAFARMLLFWSLFLPLGACWSVDRRRKRAPPDSGPRVLSTATVAILLQFVFLYLAGGLCKAGPEWTTTANALELILQNDYWNQPLASVLRESPGLLSTLTRSVLLFELFAPLFLFVPLWSGPLRLMTIVAFWLFQLGLALTVQVHLFPWFSTAGTLLFIPTSFWHRAGARLESAKEPSSTPSGIARPRRAAQRRCGLRNRRSIW